MMSEYSFRMEKILLLVELWSGRSKIKITPPKQKTQKTDKQTKTNKKPKTKKQAGKLSISQSRLDCGVLLAYGSSQASPGLPCGFRWRTGGSHSPMASQAWSSGLVFSFLLWWEFSLEFCCTPTYKSGISCM